MNVTDILSQMGGLQAIGRELGVSESQAADGAAALIPAILGGFKKQAQDHPQGVDGLGGLLSQLGGGGLLDNVLSSQPTDVSRGNDVLGQIFGSRDVSREVASQAAAQTGLDPSLLKQMLPMLAMAVAGFMAKQHAAGAAPASAQESGGAFGGGLGGLGQVLGNLLGGQASGGSVPSGGAMGGLAAMLDMNGDGNALDDLLRLGGKAFR